MSGDSFSAIRAMAPLKPLQPFGLALAGLLAALVDQQHDGHHPLLFQLRGVGVGRRRLVEKGEPAHAGRRDDPRRVPECLADEPDLHPGDRPDGRRGEQRRGFLSRSLDHVRRQVLECRAGESIAVLAAVRRVAFTPSASAAVRPGRDRTRDCRPSSPPGSSRSATRWWARRGRAPRRAATRRSGRRRRR